MPTYVYECQECGSQKDIFCKIAERPNLLPCESCGNGKMKQIITPVVVECDSITDVSWLPEAAKTVSMEHKIGVKPIESRTQFNQYVKDKGLRPADRGVNLSEV